ncbi:MULTISPECIES: hypothetical protein [unclassified Streptomyces]|uniref:hypothetical protein n=1 Tax=unclassified Streptomyces TaxID=2593676 RepID=UPI00061EAB67|nr:MULTISPECIES: hypothetical protein [unclassified Streptomyces]KJY23711.1 hypothetical protein VR46_43425 [Streptomyces sp. NRRL S-444]KOY50408.1 hypothetical protein ADK59_36950 [Streptomyces sp. XY332]TDU73745.1 hypothetical protein EDD91_0355 [Streptomyces sp. KS 21]
MGGKQDKRQEPGKSREEQERMRPVGQDPVHPGTREERSGKMSPEEMAQRRLEQMRRERGDDEMREDEF